MIIIRPIRKKDTEAFIKLALSANVGMTSLPKNPEILEKNVIEAERSFRKDIVQRQNEKYLFVLEDVATGKIGGVGAIDAIAGGGEPRYFFRLESDQSSSPLLPAPQQIPILRPIRHSAPASEVCSLYLLPEFRREGLGRLLSLSRFLFAAAHLNRFEAIVYAEMRAYVDKNQNCPFWEGIGRHFLDINYEELINIRSKGNFDVHQVLPKYPIYISLLPIEVQEAIGKIHPNTWPAFNMLSQEGFYPTNEVDIFDAGPRIEAEMKEIRTIKTSLQDVVVEITRNQIDSSRFIITNERLDFRSCYSTLQKVSKGVCISAEAADALKLKAGDIVRHVLPQAETAQHSGIGRHIEEHPS